MTNPSHRRAPGFTLVELLVVISIIAILAAAGFSAGTAAMNRARKTTSLNVATSLEQALNNFYNEYGYLPSTATDDTVIKTDETAGLDLIKALAGQEADSADMLNTKSINYLTLKEGKKSGTRGRDGIVYDNSGVVLGIYDPWGGPYMVALDLDSNEKIDFNTLNPKPKGHASRVLNNRRTAVWTAGADWQESGGGNGADDVVTW